MKDGSVQNAWHHLRWVLLIAVILSHVGFTLGHSRINPDESYQLGVSHSFSHGHNQTLKRVRAHDLSQGEYMGDLRTPPGYALVQMASGGEYARSYWIDLVMDNLGGVVFFLSWFFILEAIGPFVGVLPRLIVWLFWLVFPASLMGPLISGHSAGVISAAFFSAAIVFTLPVVQSKVSWRKAGALGVLSGLCYGVALIMRYAYWPLAAIIPLSLGFFGLRHRTKFMKAVGAGAVFFMVSGLILMVLMLHNYHVGGSFTRSNPAPSDVITLSHLLYTIPFPAFTLGHMDDSFFNAVQPLKFNPALLLSVGIIALGAYSIVRLLRTRTTGATDSPEQTAHAVFQYISLLAVVTLVLVYLFLAWMSVSSSVHPYRGGWVALAEIRYYAPIYSFLLLGVALVFARPLRKTIRPHFVIAGVAGVLLLACWIPRLTIRAQDMRTVAGTPKKAQVNPLIHYFSEMADSTPEQDIVLFDDTDSLFMRSIALLVGLDVARVDKESGFATSKPVAVIFYVSGDDHKWYLDSVSGEPLRKLPFRSGYIYQYALNPPTG